MKYFKEKAKWLELNSFSFTCFLHSNYLLRRITIKRETFHLRNYGIRFMLLLQILKFPCFWGHATHAVKITRRNKEILLSFMIFFKRNYHKFWEKLASLFIFIWFNYRMPKLKFDWSFLIFLNRLNLNQFKTTKNICFYSKIWRKIWIIIL